MGNLYYFSCTAVCTSYADMHCDRFKNSKNLKYQLLSVSVHNRVDNCCDFKNIPNTQDFFRIFTKNIWVWLNFSSENTNGLLTLWALLGLAFQLIHEFQKMTKTI